MLCHKPVCKHRRIFTLFLFNVTWFKGSFSKCTKWDRGGLWNISFIPHSFEIKPFDFCCSFYKESTVFSFVKLYECLNVYVWGVWHLESTNKANVSPVYFIFLPYTTFLSSFLTLLGFLTRERKIQLIVVMDCATFLVLLVFQLTCLWEVSDSWGPAALRLWTEVNS